MIIEGRGLRQLSELRLRLRSADMNYKCHFQPPLDLMTDKIEWNPPGDACIEFRDTYEIDQLIKILQKFKDDNYRYFGEW
jgi:hypothetical protein